jgi:peptidoglycan/xylan/chitin deacetylase (PgdA/CDA1 family)
MRFLRRNYRVLSMEHLFRELSTPSSLDPAVAITFDDGYRSAYTQAFPVLKKYQLPATIYLTMDTVETGQVAWYDRVFSALAHAPAEDFYVDLEGPWQLRLPSRESRLRSALEIVAFFRTLPNSRREACCARLEKILNLPETSVSGKVLNWDEIHAMQKFGIAFGSHTMSHPVVSRLSEPELEHELFDSRRTLEQKLGSPVRDFAFPFGKLSDCGLATAELLSRYGYRSAVTTIAGVNRPNTNRFELRRVQVGDNSSLARFAFDLARAFLEPDRSEAGSSLQAQVTPNHQASGSGEMNEAIGGSGA